MHTVFARSQNRVPISNCKRSIYSLRNIYDDLLQGQIEQLNLATSIVCTHFIEETKTLCMNDLVKPSLDFLQCRLTIHNPSSQILLAPAAEGTP